MIELPPGDDKLDTLVGREVASSVPGVSYQILQRVGAGGAPSPSSRRDRRPRAACPS